MTQAEQAHTISSEPNKSGRHPLQETDLTVGSTPGSIAAAVLEASGVDCIGSIVVKTVEDSPPVLAIVPETLAEEADVLKGPGVLEAPGKVVSGQFDVLVMAYPELLVTTSADALTLHCAEQCQLGGSHSSPSSTRLLPQAGSESFCGSGDSKQRLGSNTERDFFILAII